MKETLFARCVCVCVRVIYASHTHDYRWRPPVGSHSRGMWVCYSHPGPCNPPILINTTYLHQTEQITPAAQPPAQKQARITSQPDYSVCAHSQSNGTSVVRDESGEARAWLLIWSYLFSSSCRTLSYNLEPRLSPPPTPKKPLTESGRFICCTLMDGCSLFILRLWFQERKLPMPKTERALSVGVHCCGSGQGFYSLLGK